MDGRKNYKNLQFKINISTSVYTMWCALNNTRIAIQEQSEVNSSKIEYENIVSIFQKNLSIMNG